jgi:hypothetical protein
MQLQKSPNRWSCIPTATAIILDVPLSEVLRIVGYDGSKVLWPELPEPICRESFHIEIMQYVALKCGMALVPFISKISYAPIPDSLVQHYDLSHHLLEVMNKYNALLLGRYIGSNNRHAVAWNAQERVIYDPAGRLTLLEEFEFEYFYAAIRVRG